MATRGRENTQTSAETEIDLRKERNPRVPISAGSKLTVNKGLIEEGYFYYWGSDRPGDLEQLQDAWYEFVTDGNGQNIMVHGGNGVKLFLMRLPQKYHEEDVMRRQLELEEATFAQASLQKDEYTVGGRGIGGEGVAIKRERDLI